MMAGGTARATVAVGIVTVIALVVMLMIGTRAADRARNAADRSLAIAEAFRFQLEGYAATHRGYPVNVEATDLIKCVPPYDEVPASAFSGKPIVLNGTEPGDMAFVYRGPGNYLLLVFGEHKTIIDTFAPEQLPLRGD